MKLEEQLAELNRLKIDAEGMESRLRELHKHFRPRSTMGNIWGNICSARSKMELVIAQLEDEILSPQIQEGE